MVRSMTGFGRGEAEGGGVRLAVEVRTVNHRHFSPNLRLPREYAALEPRLTARIRERVERGHAAVTFELAPDGLPETTYAVNRQVLDAYLAVLRELREAAAAGGGPVGGALDLTRLLALPGVVERAVRQPPDEAAFLSLASAALDRALEDLVGIREEEGARLAADLEARLGVVEAAVARIEALAPERERRERERIAAKLAGLLEAAGVAAAAGADPLREARLLQEAAILADRLDLSEEITRFRSHVVLFRDTLAGGAAVGRQLTFVLQEMLREVNTMGSKANDAGIAQEVVAIKNELEKLREQAENIE